MMRGIHSRIGTTGALLMVLSLPGYAQPSSAWAAVEQLKRGDHVTCVLIDHSQIAGTLKMVTANDVTVAESRGHVTQIGRERVGAVLVRRRPRGGRWSWIGLAAGLAAGAAIAAGIGDAEGWAVAGIVAGFGGTGAGIGHLIRGHPEQVLVYRAPIANQGGVP